MKELALIYTVFFVVGMGFAASCSGCAAPVMGDEQTITEGVSDARKVVHPGAPLPMTYSVGTAYLLDVEVQSLKDAEHAWTATVGVTFTDAPCGQSDICVVMGTPNVVQNPQYSFLTTVNGPYAECAQDGPGRGGIITLHDTAELEGATWIRDVLMHELGHALGLGHTVPDVQAVMNVSIQPKFSAPQPQDIIDFKNRGMLNSPTTGE